MEELPEKITLHEAAAKGLKTEVERLLGESIEVNSRDEVGATALHWAASYGQIEVAEILIRHGADPSLVDNQNQTPWAWMVVGMGTHITSTEKLMPLWFMLQTDAMEEGTEATFLIHEAVAAGDGSKTKELLQSGMDVNQVDDGGKSPLYLAANPKVAGLLLDHGANIDMKDQIDQTPLYLAVAEEKNDLVEFLLSRKANPNIATAGDMYSPLHLAACKGNLDLIEILIRYNANLYAVDDAEDFPLHSALRCEHSEAAKFLFQSMTREHPFFFGTPLLEALQWHHHEVVPCLLSHGADVNAADNRQWTPFLVAVAGGHKQMALFLLGKGARSDSLHYDWTALHLASHHGHLDLVKVLIDRGADVNANPGPRSGTPLHRAAVRNWVDVIKLLLEHGADPQIKDNEGKTPMDLARRMNHLESYKVLQKFSKSS